MRKKILFINPSSYDRNNKIIHCKKAFMPARTLAYLAALTPKHYEVKIIDELVENIDFEQEADLVALTGMLRNMPRAMDIAREFHEKGKPVIIGGVGAYSIKERIAECGYFNSHVIGEVDDYWKDILDDFEHNNLKPRYEYLDHPKLVGLPFARFDLLNAKKYFPLGGKGHSVTSIETSRGCPYTCSFCLVNRYFGNKMRYRPIAEVVDEIKHQGSKFLFFTDDNIAFDYERAKELFTAIKPLNIRWWAQFECRVIENPALLRLAAESGCVGALVGIETLVQTNLPSINKSHNARFPIENIAQAFNDAGVLLVASLIFGFESDTPDVLRWTVDQLLKNEVKVVMPWMLTPFPGTEFFNERKNNNRLIHENYSLYDGWHPILKTENMSPEQLEDAYWMALKRFYSLRSILRRVLTMTITDIPGLLILLYFNHQVKRGVHPLSIGL